jgi:hypothetical protein
MTDLITTRPVGAKTKRRAFPKYWTFATICLYLVISGAIGVVRAGVIGSQNGARPSAGAAAQPAYPTRTLLE